MKKQHVKGIVAIVLSLMIAITVMPGMTEVMAASMSDGTSWAEIIYENLAIDKGATLTKVTDETKRQRVLNEAEKLLHTKITYYDDNSRTYIWMLKGVARQGNDCNEVIYTKDNTRENQVLIPTIKGFPVDVNQPGTYYPLAYYGDFENGQYDPCDVNHDGNVTRGELFDYYNVVSYDATTDKLTLREDLTGGANKNIDSAIYSFELTGVSNPVTIHLEKKKSLDDFEKRAIGEYNGITYYNNVYKYGPTLLRCFDKTMYNDQPAIYNRAANNQTGFYRGYNSKCVVYYYDTTSASWTMVNGRYVPGTDAEFNVTLPGDGLYMCLWYCTTDGDDIIDDSGLNRKAAPQPQSQQKPSNQNTNTNTNTKPATSNNVVSTNKSKGTATVKDAVSGGNAEVPIVYTTQGKMCRMYDPNRGEHFYTKNEAEAKYLETIGWVHESNADFTVVSATDVNAVPVYRLYNPNGAGMHFYTENAAEAIFLKSAGWNYEGISHYVYNKNSKKGVPQYRLYNPNSSIGEHNWTTNLAELNMLKSAGWKDEGICWNLV